ncbi:MAG: metal ABC transporter permease [Candidatus Aenigmarchaeota archaeon]|nr:metal ABC transporter permease [Candidatus Aenigmarchaeota archaeon]
MLELFQQGFIQNALLAGIATAIMCALVGLFLVLRKQSLFGDALAHMAFGGIALGLFLGIQPLFAAAAVAALGALGMTRLRQTGRIPADAAIAVLLSTGLALGITLVSLVQGFNTNLFSFLFGSILLVSREEALMTAAIAVAIAAPIAIHQRKLLHLAFSEEQAKASGLPAAMLDYLFIIAASIAVIVSIRLSGILLVSSLLVLPNLAAIMLGLGFKRTMLASAAISVLAVVAGVWLSYVANIAPSGAIVILLVAFFLAALAAKKP